MRFDPDTARAMFEQGDVGPLLDYFEDCGFDQHRAQAELMLIAEASIIEAHDDLLTAEQHMDGAEESAVDAEVHLDDLLSAEAAGGQVTHEEIRDAESRERGLRGIFRRREREYEEAEAKYFALHGRYRSTERQAMAEWTARHQKRCKAFDIRVAEEMLESCDHRVLRDYLMDAGWSEQQARDILWCLQDGRSLAYVLRHIRPGRKDRPLGDRQDEDAQTQLREAMRIVNERLSYDMYSGEADSSDEYNRIWTGGVTWARQAVPVLRQALRHLSRVSVSREGNDVWVTVDRMYHEKRQKTPQSLQAALEGIHGWIQSAFEEGAVYAVRDRVNELVQDHGGNPFYGLVGDVEMGLDNDRSNVVSWFFRHVNRGEDFDSYWPYFVGELVDNPFRRKSMGSRRQKTPESLRIALEALMPWARTVMEAGDDYVLRDKLMELVQEHGGDPYYPRDSGGDRIGMVAGLDDETRNVVQWMRENWSRFSNWHYEFWELWEGVVFELVREAFHRKSEGFDDVRPRLLSSDDWMRCKAFDPHQFDALVEGSEAGVIADYLDEAGFDEKRARAAFRASVLRLMRDQCDEVNATGGSEWVKRYREYVRVLEAYDDLRRQVFVDWHHRREKAFDPRKADAMRSDSGVLHDYLLDEGWTEADIDKLFACLYAEENAGLSVADAIDGFDIPFGTELSVSDYVDYDEEEGDEEDEEAFTDEAFDMAGADNETAAEQIHEELVELMGHDAVIENLRFDDFDSHNWTHAQAMWDCTFHGTFRDWYAVHRSDEMQKAFDPRKADAMGGDPGILHDYCLDEGWTEADAVALAECMEHSGIESVRDAIAGFEMEYRFRIPLSSYRAAAEDDLLQAGDDVDDEETVQGMMYDIAGEDHRGAVELAQDDLRKLLGRNVDPTLPSFDGFFEHDFEQCATWSVRFDGDFRDWYKVTHGGRLKAKALA